MAGRVIGVARITVSLLVVGMLWGAVPVQGETVWRMQAAPPGPRLNLWMGWPARSGQLSIPELTRSLGSGVFADHQNWVLTGRGGTPLQPWFEIRNYWAKYVCLSGQANGSVGVGPCEPDRTGWWQFRTLTNQPGNPRLSQATTDPRLWRIHWYGHGQGTPGASCLVVPHSQFRAGTRLAVQPCTQSANHQWWVYRSSSP